MIVLVDVNKHFWHRCGEGIVIETKYFVLFCVRLMSEWVFVVFLCCARVSLPRPVSYRMVLASLGPCTCRRGVTHSHVGMMGHDISMSFEFPCGLQQQFRQRQWLPEASATGRRWAQFKSRRGRWWVSKARRCKVALWPSMTLQGTGCGTMSMWCTDTN